MYKSYVKLNRLYIHLINYRMYINIKNLKKEAE